ncbi:hypothetical protein GGI23_000310 [Coemansia sp. RSA 2559]|nr:hypothetical protein GGI23_000310 [Coemansia sp. RSA 2559]KAJ2869353.1 hypothetical protein GGI22_000305 [Coemansia erecta]
MTAPLPQLTPEYMRTMYPPHLELLQAQVFFRHGERSPVKLRLFPDKDWPFCERSNYLHSEFMKAVGRFVPKEEPMPLPDADRMAKGTTAEAKAAAAAASASASAASEEDDSRYTKRTWTTKTGLEYEPAEWSVRLGSDAMYPDDNGRNNSRDPRMCNGGQLTDIGLLSLERVGRHLRELYVDKLGIIPQKIGAKPSEWLYIRSTDYSRVLQSTYALLTGLYPNNTAAATTKKPAVFDAEFLETFPIHTRMHNHETMHGNYACYNFIKQFINPPIAEARKLKWIDDVYRQASELKSIGSKAKQIMNTPNFGSTIHPVYDELQALESHGVPLPADISRDLLASLGRAASYQWNSPIHYVQGQRLGFSLLVNDVVSTMAQAAKHYSQGKGQTSQRPRLGAQRNGDLLLSSNGGIREETPEEIPGVPKLALYGGHDITVGPLAVIMGNTSSEWLPFASTLTFELFKDTRDGGSYVRTRLNDKALQMATCEPLGKHHPQMGSSMCTLDAFLEHIAPIMATEEDFKAECGSFPSTTPLASRRNNK